MNEIVLHKATPVSITARASKALVPAVIENLGEKGKDDFWEFFANNIRNPNTRAGYLRAAYRFFDWCQGIGIGFDGIKPYHVGLYVESLLREPDEKKRLSPGSVKFHLAGLRQLFDHLVLRQNLAFNPAASVKGPKMSQRSDGRTPELSADEAARLFLSIPAADADGADHLVNLRDRALLATLLFSWVRISAALGMSVKDYTGDDYRVEEKGGLWRKIPVHSEAAPLMAAYIEAAGLDDFPDSPLFRGTIGGKGRKPKLAQGAFTRQGAWYMIKRRCAAAGLSTEYTNHSFRATGITEFMNNGGQLHDAQIIAGHADARTTKLYDRSEHKVTRNMMERVHIEVS